MMPSEIVESMEVVPSYTDTDLERPSLPDSSAWGDGTVTVKIGDSPIHLHCPYGKTPEWLRDAVVQLDGVVRMRENWDSYGARPVSQRTVQHALDLLLQVLGPTSECPRILATNDGGVELAWRAPRKELEIIVDAPYRGDIYFCNNATEEEEERPLGIDFDVPRHYFEKFSRAR